MNGYQLPHWVNSSPPSPHRRSGHAGVCSKAASSSTDRSNPRVVTAASRAVEKPDAGNAGTRVGPGGPRKRANAVVANNRDAIGSGFLSPCSANHLRSRPLPRRPSSRFHPSLKRARASAQTQSPWIFRIGRVTGPVAMSCSLSPRPSRPSGSVRATAVERYATCWIGKRVIGGVAVRDTDYHVSVRDCDRRDVFRGCAHVLASPRSHVPPRRRRQWAGSGSPVPPVPSR